VVRPTSGSSPDRVGEVDEETGTEQCCGRWVSLERYYCLERCCPEPAALTFHTRHSVGCDSVCNRVGGFGATPAVRFLIRIPTKGTELNGATPTRSRTRSAPAVDPGQSAPKALPRPDGVVAHRGNAATNLKTLTDFTHSVGRRPQHRCVEREGVQPAPGQSRGNDAEERRSLVLGGRDGSCFAAVGT
jgi:hypothetical protein